jgi:malonyl-CoA decarboxylase
LSRFLRASIRSFDRGNGGRRTKCLTPTSNRIDPVARFHLGNGAWLERINWLGNTELHAIEESFGIMVNYLYDHDSIENNHEAFACAGTIARSPDVDALLKDPD